MGRERRSPLTAETAWQQLQGTWVYRLGAPPGSWVEYCHTFTPDRRWIWVRRMAGGILPGVEQSEDVTEIADVAVEGRRILLTLGAKSNPQHQPGGVMTVRFRDPDHIVIEDGHVLTRAGEEEADLTDGE